MAWKKAGGKRREDHTQEKWWWWWWWWWRWRWRWRGWMAMEMMMNDSWRESNVIYIHDFMPFFSPQRVCSRAGTWATVRIKRHVVFTQRKKIHREDFTHRSLYTERDLHRAAFTQTLLHTDAFIYRSFYTEKPCHHRKPLNRAALHTDAFSQRSFYTQEL